MTRNSSTHPVIRLLLLAVLASCSFLCPASGHAKATMEIIDMDLQVSPNPIPCGGSATATVTIQTYPGGSLTQGVITKVTLWDNDSGVYGNDDALDHEPVTLTTDMGKVTVSLTLHCEIKDAGCDLYGPAGNSGESGTEVFATILGSDVESPHVYVQCKQMEVDAALDMDGTDSISAGGDAEVTLSADTAIPGLDHATWKMEFDPANLSVSQVRYLHPQLAPYTTHIINPDHILFTLRHLPVPLNVSGPMVAVTFTGKSSPAVRWDTTDIRVSADSVFYNSLGGVLAVCDGGAHSIFIAPLDTTKPVVDPGNILFTRNRIVGAPGAVSDDMGPLENYLTVALLDEDHKLVSQEFAETDGSFTLDKFFELAMGRISTLQVYNGVGLTASYQFKPTATPSGAVSILLLDNQPPSNLPPTATIIDVVTDLAVPSWVQLQANAIDPDGDQVSLYIDWGDTKFSDYGPPQLNGSIFFEEHTYAAEGIYQIKAKARDSKGLEGEWSPPHAVVIPPP